MVHEKLTTLEQMNEEFVLFCKDLLRDGHIGYPDHFVEVMWGWEVEGQEGTYRLDDVNLAKRFLQQHRVDPRIIDEVIVWIKQGGGR